MSNSVIIGIDGNEANVSSRVGSNLYAYEILSALSTMDVASQFVVYLKDEPLADMPQSSTRWTYRVIRPGKLWTQWRLPLDLYLHRPRPHVFFSPGHYGPRTCPVASVVTIMDLAFLTHPSLFLKHTRGVSQLSQWTEYSVRQAERVVTISEQTKHDVAKVYGVDSDSITVAYPGIDRSFFRPQSEAKQQAVQKRYGIGHDYFLYVGTLQPRKNLTRLLEAFERLPKRYAHTQLVLAGQKGWMFEDFERRMQASKVRDRIRLLGYVDREDLPALYSGAHALCLVGLYEGFGMPAAEALSCGTIPVVSEISSLPEVVGQAGILVDPYSVMSIQHGLTATLRMTESQRKKRLELGKAHISQFDWHASAAAIYTILYDIATQ